MATCSLLATDCPSCRLADDGEPGLLVYGWGAKDSRLVVVGEAPGTTEVDEGRPFLGPSGKLLWTTLGKMGVPRRLVYATNALLCAPPSDGLIGAREIRACHGRLLEELDGLRNKQVIVALGTKAANSLRDDRRGIGELSGRVEWSERFGCWLVYAYHPAAVLRNPSLYLDFEWGLRQALHSLRQSGPPSAPPTDISYSITDGLPVLAAFLQRQPKVVCDIETTGLDPRTETILTIGFAWSPTQAVIVPVEGLSPEAIRTELGPVLENNQIRWVYHNAKFDTSWLAIHYGIQASIGVDTMLLHYCLDERSGGEGGGYHDLKRLARKYCGAPAWADEIASDQMATVPLDQLYEYQANDLCYTYRLETVLRQLVSAEPASRTEYPTPLETHDRLLLPASRAIGRLERRGIAIDTARLDALTDSYIRQIGAAREEVRRLVPSLPEEFNPASWMQVAKVLYGEGGMGYPNLRHTDEATLHELQRMDAARQRPPNTFLTAVLTYRSLVHTKTTYLDGVRSRLASDRRLHTTILLHGTTSGRLSSRNPNLQNLPADSVIKELFVPSRPDRVLCNADYRRLEIAVLAWYARDERLAKDVMSADFHWQVALGMFQTLIAEMDQARQSGSLDQLEGLCEWSDSFADFARRQADTTTRTDSVDELYGWMKTRLRRQAKYVSFGIIYGEGAESLASPETGLGVSPLEATKYRQRWMATYPVAIAWLDGQASLARRERWVESASGRRRRFPYPPTLQTHLTNEAMNHPIQALASDINLLALLRLDQLLPERGLGDVLMPVHDSILTEIDRDRQDEATTLIRETMASVLVDDLVRFDVDLAVGRNWAECH